MLKSWKLAMLVGTILIANVASGADVLPVSESPDLSAAGESAAPVGRLTVEGVVARGGRQISAVEMQEFIPGTQWYASIVGKPYVVTNRPDGTWRGEAGRLPPFQGTWRIDGSGRLCRMLTERGGVAITAEESCLFYFKVDSDYFVSGERVPSSEVVPQRLLN
jgi:hypothetical protein